MPSRNQSHVTTFRSESMDVMQLRTGLASLLDRVRRLAGFGRNGARADELATQEALRDSEERLRLVRRATGLGMYEIDWAARRRYWSPELRALLRVPDELDINTDADLLERIIPEDMRPAFRDKMRASLDPDSSGDYEDEHRITRFDGSTGWLLLRGKTFFADGPNGRYPTRSIGLVVDISDRKHGEEANALHASTVLSSNDAIFSIDFGRTIRTWNPGAERLYGYTAWEAIGRPISILAPDHLHGEQFSLYTETTGGKAVVRETVRRHKSGKLIPVGISAAPIFAEGKVAGVAAVHRDMTDRRHYEEHMAFTMRELSHRTKNMLAVVQGLTHMIARRSDSIEAFETRLRGCIQALAYSHDLLVQHDWEGATLEELLRVQLASFGGLDSGRILAQGPEVFLQPQAMQSLGLILHELGTNATKHGALSVESGRVTIDWTWRDEGVALTWTESGGPAVVAASRKGFGQVVFERIGAALDGAIATEFRPEGLVCAITIGASNLLPIE
jgi:PAS domain S-box-containing protein